MRPIDVLYEDNHLLALAKPARMPVQGDRTGDLSLLDWAKDYLKEKYAKKGNVYVGLVHRLDRPVSGVVLFAKTSKAASRLSEQFREGAVKKIYRALVEGAVEPKSGELGHYISKGPQNKVSVSDHEVPGGRFAQLRYRILDRTHAKFPDASFLEIELLTGRKHQIRAQLSHIGHPIIGDRKYGSRMALKNGMVALCAKSLEINHPVGERIVHISKSIEEAWPD